MTNIIVLTHGLLAEGLVSSIELILGTHDKIDTMGLFHGDNVEQYKQKVEAVINGYHEDDDVLIFTDLYGGTPNNTAAKIIYENKLERNIKCFVGVNLPILLEAMTMKDVMSFGELVKELDRNCKDSIFDIGKKLQL